MSGRRAGIVLFIHQAVGKCQAVRLWWWEPAQPLESGSARRRLLPPWRCSRHDLSHMHQPRLTQSMAAEGWMPIKYFWIKYFSHSVVHQWMSRESYPSPGFMYLTVSRHVLLVNLHQSGWSDFCWDSCKWNYLLHLLQIFINCLKSVRMFVLTPCQTLSFAKYVIFEVFPFMGKWKQRFGETKTSILLLKLIGQISRCWATQKFKAGKSQTNCK